MGAPGLTSPIRSDGFKNLQLNAGVFLLNFDYSQIANAAALKTAVAAAITAGTNILGMTRGGGSFTIKREVRTPEVDGRRYAFKGDKFVDSMDGYLSGTLVEITPENVKRVMSTADIQTSGAKTTITFHTAINAETDYIDHLCWVGDIADGRFVLIEIDNAFNTADFSLTFADKNEATLPFEFHAHQGDVLDYDELPCRIVYFNEAA
jgi:6-phosphofructokinase